MATMCKWGDIKFSVTSDKVLTFRNFKRESTGRWASHSIIGKRPKTEFLGPDMDEITLEVILDAEYGVNPRSEMYKFRSALKSGEVSRPVWAGGLKLLRSSGPADLGCVPPRVGGWIEILM